MRCFLSFLCLFALIGLVDAGPRYSGCSGGECQLLPASVRWEWRAPKDAPNQVNLFKDGVPVGTFFRDEGVYYPWNGKAWLQAATVPSDVPEGLAGDPLHMAYKFFGVNEQKIDTRERYILNGKQVSREKALQTLPVMKQSTLADDSKNRHLTGIGRDTATAKKLQEVLSSQDLVNPLKGLRVQVYDLSHAVDKEMIAPFRLELDEAFQQAGSVVICQDAEGDGGGKVLGTWHGVPTAEEVMEGLRRINPDHNPNKSPPAIPKKPPQPSKPSPGVGGEVSLSPFLFAGALGLAGVPLVKRRR